MYYTVPCNLSLKYQVIIQRNINISHSSEGMDPWFVVILKNDKKNNKIRSTQLRNTGNISTQMQIYIEIKFVKLK